jgi:hypothetical protein
VKSGEAQKAVLDLVNDPDATVFQTAMAYRKMLQTPGRFDWSIVNRAIIDRWSQEGLTRMMRVAWLD